MKTLNELAELLSRQIEKAAAGQADTKQADIVCRTTDSLIKLARLQLDTADIDWSKSDEVPCIPALTRKPSPLVEVTENIECVSKQFAFNTSDLSAHGEEELNNEIDLWDGKLNELNAKVQTTEPGSSEMARLKTAQGKVRKYLLALRDEVNDR